MTLDQLQARLGHVFADARLLQEALTHRSFGQPNNERFEFLGDSILNCVIAIALFERFGELREGELSRVRASLVRQDALHRIALDLDLGDPPTVGVGGGAVRLLVAELLLLLGERIDRCKLRVLGHGHPPDRSKWVKRF